VARAFIDQVLAAVREADGVDAPVVGAVEGLYQETARRMVRFRYPESKGGLRQASWQRLLTEFVCGVDAVDRQVWAHLRDRLLADDSSVPVPALPGAGEPSYELSGLADPGLLPGDLDGWPELADLLARDDWQDLADLLDIPVTQPLAGSPGGPEPNRAREPDLDQGGPDPSWLRRLVPDSPRSSAPTPAPRQAPAELSAPDASPPPDRTNTGGIPPGTGRSRSRKRARDEEHQPGSGGKRVARQQE
jgi:hypothetical protein